MRIWLWFGFTVYTLRSMAGVSAHSSFLMEKDNHNDIVSSDHVLCTIHKCCNGVRWKASIQRFEINKLRWGASIQKDMILFRFKSKGFRRFDIVERGKLRHIQAVHVSERVAQKMICDYSLKQLVYSKLIYDNSASQEG